MPALIPFLIGNWRGVGIGLLVLAVGGYIGLLRLERNHYKAQAEQEHAAFVDFKTRISAEAEIQRQRNEAIKAHDDLLKEEAESDHQVALDRLRADVERVRHERDSARRAFLSAAPSASKCPDGQVCLDRAEYLAAYRGLVSEVRGAGDEGSEIAVDLQTAQHWAKKPHGR